MSDEPQFYSTSNQGLAAFPIYILSEDAFSHITLDEKRPLIWLHDVIAGNSCAELAKMYQDGAQLRNAHEFSECWEFIGFKIRRALRNNKP